MQRIFVLILASAAGCAGSQAAAPSSATNAAATAQPPETEREVVGTCGPAASYRYVATKPTCADGRNPFEGDAEMARRSRVGTVQGASGKPVDLYRLPCPEGPRSVYVDMYQCDPSDPEGERMAQAERRLPDTEPWLAFVRGGLPSMLGHCEEPDILEGLVCAMGAASQAEIIGAFDASANAVAQSCGRFRPRIGSDGPGPRDQFIAYLALLSYQRLQALGTPWPLERWQEAMRRWGAACGLTPAGADRILESIRGTPPPAQG